MRNAAVLAASICLASCATLFPPARLDVTSTASTKFDPSLSYGVIAQVNGIGLTSAQLATYTRRMLTAAGLKLVPENQQQDSADILVSVLYEDPPLFGTYNTYELSYKTTGIDSSTTVEHIDDKGRKISTTTYTPHREATGLERVEHTVVVFAYELLLTASARDAKKSAKPLWAVDVRATGSESKLALNAPYFLKAAQPYVGKTTDMVRVVVPQSDPGAKFIKTGRAAPAQK